MLRILSISIAFSLIAATGYTQDKEPAKAPAKEPAKPAQPEAFTKAAEAARKGDFAGARKLLEAEAEKGNGEALNAVGELAIAGRDGKSDPAAAAKYFQRAVDAGYLAAHVNLGRLYMTGPEGVKKDEERAKFHIRQAAEAGVPQGQTMLARLLEAAVDLSSREPNWKEPREWLEKAVAQGDAEATLLFIPYLDEGRGGPRDPVKATELCFAAAKAGSVVAMNEIGVRYQKGIGIRQDNVAAVGWFSLASQQGLPVAMVNLGSCYERGDGTVTDMNRAGTYYSAAAKLNHPVAQMLLGNLFEEGKGTELNLTFAYVNYHRAAAQGLTAAEAKRDAVAKRLTPKQKNDAEKLLAGGTSDDGKKKDQK